MVDYIGDYVRMGIPSAVWASYNALTELMGELGLTVSEKKLVAPSMQVTCLGVLTDTVKGTLLIPPEKLHDIPSGASLVGQGRGIKASVAIHLGSLALRP